MKLIAGLGNPGDEYRETRHNFGWMAVDALAAAHRIRVWGFRYHARIGKGRVAGTEVALLKPRTFMNLSGNAVAPALHGHGLTPADLIVVHDDLDLPLGKLKISPAGGAAGHNGVASVIEKLGTDQFLRLRLGIGRPERRDTVDYVLAPFEPHELAARDRVIAAAREALCDILAQGAAAAMNRYHRKDFAAEEP